MAEAPKRIWATHDGSIWKLGAQFATDVPYVRADIADDMLAALKAVCGSPELHPDSLMRPNLAKVIAKAEGSNG